MKAMPSGALWPIFDLVDLAGGHRGRGVIGVFICYLDDSDHSLTSVITLAGYLSRLEVWKQFETAVEPIFNDYGVGTLHTKELHNTHGDFDDWSKIKKASFIKDVYDIARQYVNYGISISARKSYFKEHKKHHPKESRMSPYGACFAAIMHNIMYSNTIGESVRRDGLSFIIEKGHRNNGELEAWFHRRSKHPLYAGIARAISFADKTSSRALQIADFMAFYSRRLEAYGDRSDGNSNPPLENLYEVACQRVAHFHKVMRSGIRPVPMDEAVNPSPFPPLLPVGGYVPRRVQTPLPSRLPQAPEPS